MKHILNLSRLKSSLARLDNIPLIADYNFMADLLELPKTKKGFYLFIGYCRLSN